MDWPLGPVAFAMSSTVDINTPYAVDQDMTPSEVAKLYAARNRSSIQIREAYKIKKWGYPLPPKKLKKTRVLNKYQYETYNIFC